MKTHTVTLTLIAPNHVTDVAGIVERLFWIGKEDAETSIADPEDEDRRQEIKDAMSLHLKSVVGQLMGDSE
jgi:hypothetical protein